MGINSMHVTNIKKKIGDYNSDLLNFKDQFVIVPYLASGYIDYSNYGQVDGQRLIDNFETYKRLWTGNDSFCVSWKDSVTATNTEEDPKIKINYKIGDAILGWLENYNSSVEIKTDTSFEEYKAQTSEKSFTFRINASEFELDTNWEFMFYKVPEISKNILFRVESLDREYLGKDLMCYVLTLRAINQELSNTGRAKQQNITPNSPGQGYYDLQVVEEFTPSEDLVEGVDYKQFYDRWLIADKTKMFNNPCKKVVVKAFGLCGFSNCAFWGRKVNAGGDFRDFGTPHWIFPINFTNASTYTLYRTQSEQTNYYMVMGATPCINYTREAFEALKSTMNPSVLFPSQGLLLLDKNTTLNTNPKVDINGNPTTDLYSAANFKYQLFGQNLIIDGSLGYKKWVINVPSKSIPTDMISGCAQYYNVGGEKNIEDVMFDNFWTQKSMVTLPINKWNTLNFGWTIGSSYAALVAKQWLVSSSLMLIGIAATIIQKVNAPKFTNFNCLLPASLVDFMLAEAQESITDLAPIGFDRNYIKLDYFLNSEENDISKVFNTSTINTSFEADLTDQFISKRLGGNVLETTIIGQTQYENGENILPSGEAFLLNGDTTLVNISDENEGFIIDEIHLQAIFKGDYSIEFLDKQGSVIWSGVFQSQGKWTGSLREINTWIRTSIYGRENVFLAQPLPWPKTPAELNLIGLAAQDIDQNFGNIGFGKVWEITQEPNPSISQDTTLEYLLQRELFGLRQNSIVNGKIWYGSVLPDNPHYDPEYENPLKFGETIVLKSNWKGTQEDLKTLYESVEIEFGTKYMSPDLGYSYQTKKQNGLSGTLNFETDLNWYYDNRNLITGTSYFPGNPETGVGGIAYFTYNVYQKQNWELTYSIFVEDNQLKLTYLVKPKVNSEWGFGFKNPNQFQAYQIQKYNDWKYWTWRNKTASDYKQIWDSIKCGFAIRNLKIIAFPPKEQ